MLTFNTTTVNINPGAFNDSSDKYDVPFVVSAVTGAQSFVVVPGVSYQVRVGQQNLGAFFFDVDAAGNVTSQNTAAATGSGNTLTFNTTTVTIDPGAFNSATSEYDVPAVVPAVTGVQTFTAVPGVSYAVRVGRQNIGTFFFDIDASGNVSSQNIAAASGSGNTLTFNTTSMTIDPGAYNSPDSKYYVPAVVPAVTGMQTFTVVPGVSYVVSVGLQNISVFFFDVDAAGNVSSQNATAASGAGDTLSFNTTTIQVSPSTANNWLIPSAFPTTSGAASVTLAPGLSYFLQSSGLVQFAVSDPCAITPNQVVVGGTTFNFSCPLGTVSLFATADSFLRQGAKDRNEGANPMMRVRKSGKNRSLVKFDQQAIDDFGTVTKATLRLNISDIGTNWGTGRTVDAHALNVEFAEGDGKAAGVPNSESTRGSGEGVTWKCAVDTEISNQQTNCNPTWLGGDFVPATAPGQTHMSGQTGAVEWDVTADVWNGDNEWLIKKTEEGQNGIVEYYTREGAADAGDPDLAPTLVLE